MEFMQRGSLSDILQSTKFSELIDTTLSFRIATDICRGMTFLHSRDILHRDLKSSNVFLDLNWTAKIGDFGLSRFNSSNNTMTTMQGTLAWMAPEVLQHAFPTQYSDVYSFAIIIWELISHK
eukprot:TRINITY_DN1235_c0_g3_i4.p1 TRINITY_DN1235_c0_g3~~TRINITY_DN1235_c0_g3_i4.p1  ORF type:complete len:122 (-),score=51.24 TRINITY_DN1235_c0_g3_i4:256-621(-)